MNNLLSITEQWIRKNNPSNQPYHSTDHNFYARDMYTHLCELSNIQVQEMIDGQVALSFHDTGHTGKSDNIISQAGENLSNALNLWYKFREEYDNILSQYSVNPEHVELGILCTGYNHRELQQDWSKKFGPLLRDADLLNNLRKPEDAIIRGKLLALERGVEWNKDTIHKNKEFYIGLKPYTPAGKIFFDEIKSDIIDLLNKEIEMNK